MKTTESLTPNFQANLTSTLNDTKSKRLSLRPMKSMVRIKSCKPKRIQINKVRVTKK